MGERSDHDPTAVPDMPRATDLQARRITAAAARAADHAARELWLLERAAQARDDAAGRGLEDEADTASRDFVAMTEEHGLDR